MAMLPPPAAPPPHRAPIWAPNPGVPLTARILSITFGVLLALTVLFTLVSDRPPDLPLPPRAWDTYTLKPGITTPRPAGWTAQTVAEKDDFACVRFWQRDGGPVTVDLLGWRLSAPADERVADAIAKQVESDLHDACPQYVSAAVDGDRRRFTCTLDGLAMSGAWTLATRDNMIVAFIALTPTDGAAAMDGILDTMTAGVQVAEPSR